MQLATVQGTVQFLGDFVVALLLEIAEFDQLAVFGLHLLDDIAQQFNSLFLFKCLDGIQLIVGDVISMASPSSFRKPWSRDNALMRFL